MRSHEKAARTARLFIALRYGQSILPPLSWNISDGQVLPSYDSDR
jgi:hypothetical protein